MEESAALTEAKASSQPEWAQLTVTLIGSRRTRSRTADGRGSRRDGGEDWEVGAVGKFADAARNQENPVQRAAARPGIKNQENHAVTRGAAAGGGNPL